uniref:PIEZO domain-containing protein n=1 Tax=Haemonchus placei TaxID=6290 RepID=A0A0N4WCJ0_HAEPC
LVRWINDCVEFLWRLTEVHISSIVFIIVAVFIAKNLCALYVPLALLLSLALLLPSALTGVFSVIMCSFLCVVGALNMIYQVTGLVVAIIALALQSVVIYRQRHHRRVHGLPDASGRVFPSFQIEEFDRSMVDMLKFLVDFGFYKFGFEISVIVMGINAWIRMDMLGAVMCIWIGIFVLNKRSVCRKLWYIFVIYLAILFPMQYIIYVGLPEDTCIPYPWDHLFGEPSSLTKNVNFDIWFGLSNYAINWPAENLIADFILLLVASAQLTVFRCEGTANDSIFVNDDYDLKPNNPRYDFIATQRSFVDFIKIGIFHYGHWITLIMVLIAGIGGTSLFALGYIMITFWILWQGNNLYVMNPYTNNFKSTLAKWKTLISYTVFTMFCKVALQLVGCVFLEWFYDKSDIHESMRCTIRQLFSIICVNSVVQARKTDLDRMCTVIPQEAQIGFDAIALGFLVFQLRIFHSWFFQHCMVEYRSEIILANRGAVLKNQLIEKEMKEQNEQQKAKFDEIRQRTEVIRERYKKQMEKGDIICEPQTYAHAKRAGDYYMFDYDPATDELVKPVESFVPEVTPGATKFEKLDPGQLVYAATAHQLDLAKTLDQVKEAEKISGSEERMIEAMQKDSKIVSLFKFLLKMTTNGIDMLCSYLNRLSREHRYVAYVLSKEKEKLKEGYSESLSDTSVRLTDLRHRMNMTDLLLVQSEGDIQRMESAALSDWQQRSVMARLMNALSSCVAANTDLLCYILAVLAHASGGGLITLPLPLMVFLWGTLSNPRPSKFFWVAMIAYTEFVIVTKFICQFTIFEFNSVSTQSKQVLGVQRQSNFAAFDVPLLFALFFHRYMLRKLGLWKVCRHPEFSLFFAFRFVTLSPKHAFENSLVSFCSDVNRLEAGADISPLAAGRNDPDAGKNPIARFISQLFKPKFRYIRDLYPIMFGLDVVAFLIVAFGYSSFGEGGSGNVIGDIQASRIPLTFVVMLIVMTLLIVIDRGLYLRKWVYGKLAYQLVMIVFLHIWIFFLLPYLTRR